MKRIRADLIWLLFLAFVVNFMIIYGRKMPVGGNGGDTIIHMGMIRGIYLGRNPFLDQHYNVYPNWYPFLYHSLIAILSKLTGVSIWNLMIWTPLVFAMLMVASWYLLGQELNKDYGGSLLGALSFLIMKSQLFPNPKALIPIFLPLFYLEILEYQKNERNRHLVYAGILLGLMLWSHYGVALPILVGVSLYSLLRSFRGEKAWLYVPLVAGIAFFPFVVNIAFNIEPGSSLMVEGGWLGDLSLSSTIKRVLPPVWGMVLMSLAFVVEYKNNEDTFWHFIFFVVGIMLIVNILPSIMFLTTGMKIFSSRFSIPLHYTYLLLYFYGIASIIDLITPRKLVVYGVSAILLAYGSLSFVHYNFHNSTTLYASSTYTYKDFEDLAGNYTKGLVKVSEWINENTQKDDYLIGHPYTLEWIAGFTGRPVVAVSYGHGNPFLNMKQRRQDIREFFTDPEKRLEIIEKYGIKYVILDPYAEENYNVTVQDFREDFEIVFQWWKFYILEIKEYQDSN
ncbi:glycosyltransferase family 39 protein [Pyrococcus kukulkanii]|uniref:Transporter n=1 Tax=Pyrococcus kukulkanii TaxID=1609559 RepID=A0A127B9N8_9EURY|nr:glycosyltransferase family 39 protein [Pyrococcus kukulkanii]AMM53479.1 transporter [Pyrococcus kukulkanii]